jgi:hypothetical protein
VLDRTHGTNLSGGVLTLRTSRRTTSVILHTTLSRSSTCKNTGNRKRTRTCTCTGGRITRTVRTCTGSYCYPTSVWIPAEPQQLNIINECFPFLFSPFSSFTQTAYFHRCIVQLFSFDLFYHCHLLFSLVLVGVSTRYQGSVQFSCVPSSQEHIFTVALYYCSVSIFFIIVTSYSASSW